MADFDILSYYFASNGEMQIEIHNPSRQLEFSSVKVGWEKKAADVIETDSCDDENVLCIPRPQGNYFTVTVRFYRDTSGTVHQNPHIITRTEIKKLPEKKEAFILCTEVDKDGNDKKTHRKRRVSPPVHHGGG